MSRSRRTGVKDKMALFERGKVVRYDIQDAV
jgi:hypothetical protein